MFFLKIHVWEFLFPNSVLKKILNLRKYGDGK